MGFQALTSESDVPLLPENWKEAKPNPEQTYSEEDL